MGNTLREQNSMVTPHPVGIMSKLHQYWSARELVLVGVFAAATKLSSLLIALAGGGMNPVSLIVKNIVFTTLLIVLLTKVRKPGTLLLFTLVSTVVSCLLMGGSITLLPTALLGALVAEGVVLLFGMRNSQYAPWVAAGVYDFAAKAFSLGVSYLFLREIPAIMMMVLPIVLLGYIGSLMGLWIGWKTVGELKHAGFVR